MDGLIQVGTSGAGGFLVGLDKEGTVWVGGPHGGMAATGKIAWPKMVEASIAGRPGGDPLAR